MKTTMVLALMLWTTQALALAKAQVLDVRGLSNLVDGPVAITNTFIPNPSYASIEAKLEGLAKDFPARAQLVKYGKTVDGLDLNVLRIALNDTRVRERVAVQISGVIHGNEYLGIEEKLPEYFLRRADGMPGLEAFLKKGGIVYFIPVVNPDGFSRKDRLNSNRADLNRDFDLLPESDARFTQPETRALADYLERDLAASGARLGMSLDYHCCVPALITPWTYKDAQPEPADRAVFNELGQTGKSVLGFRYGNAMETVNYNALGSSIDYFYAKYGTLALAIEGRWWGEEDALADHAKFWDEMFRRLAAVR